MAKMLRYKGKLYAPLASRKSLVDSAQRHNARKSFVDIDYERPLTQKEIDIIQKNADKAIRNVCNWLEKMMMDTIESYARHPDMFDKYADGDPDLEGLNTALCDDCEYVIANNGEFTIDISRGLPEGE